MKIIQWNKCKGLFFTPFIQLIVILLFFLQGCGLIFPGTYSGNPPIEDEIYASLVGAQITNELCEILTGEEGCNPSWDLDFCTETLGQEPFPGFLVGLEEEPSVTLASLIYSELMKDIFAHPSDQCIQSISSLSCDNFFFVEPPDNSGESEIVDLHALFILLEDSCSQIFSPIGDIYNPLPPSLPQNPI